MKTYKQLIKENQMLHELSSKDRDRYNATEVKIIKILYKNGLDSLKKIATIKHSDKSIDRMGKVLKQQVQDYKDFLKEKGVKV